jgi:predicted ATPase with chaperone activity
MGPKQLRQRAVLDDTAETLLGAPVGQVGLSARADHRVLKLARTITDLAAAGGGELGPRRETRTLPRALQRRVTKHSQRFRSARA